VSYSRSDSPSIFIIAGEASGDMYGAALVAELKKRIPDIKIHGIGGEKMKRAGMSMLFSNSELAVVGIVEIFAHITPIINAFRNTVRWLREQRPSLLVLIDYPEFNMLVASKAKELNIPVMYFISPQIWAWRQGRVKKIKKIVDRMAVILPFEKEFYKKYGVDVEFVGHPLVDMTHPLTDRASFRRQFGIPPEKKMISILPGSRGGEIKRLLPCIADSIDAINSQTDGIHFIIPVAPGLGKRHKSAIYKMAHELENKNMAITTVEGMTLDAINASDLAIAASGTVTLEAALLGTPSVVIYKVSPLSYCLGRHLIKVKYASIVNLVADKMILPELMQSDATPERISETVYKMLDDRTCYQKIKAEMKEAVKQLGPPGAIKRVPT
jgi:lipid-A-disaccharide synthase